jgi:2-polyprenyl-3-methyl-5-hydroxy-6-metoxy-1,4-benzoquinol methylase
LNENELYEKQYGEKKLISINSLPFLRRIFRKYDMHREDLALNLLDDGDRLLDFGCGSGSLVLRAKDRFKEAHGIDISPSRIEEAKKKAIERFGEVSNLHFSCYNINERIDAPDDWFDVVTSIAVIEHIFDVYFAISEIHRVMKSGGILIAEVPNIAYIRHRIHLLFGRLPVTSSPHNWQEIGWDGGHLHYFTKESFCTLLEECGFEILKVSGSGLFARFRNFYPALLTGDICVKAKKC